MAIVTERQKRTLQNLATAPSMAEAMRKAGYAENYARNPQQLKEKEGWKEILDKYLPEKAVGKKLKDLSEATNPEYIKFPAGLTREQVEEMMKSMDIPKKQYTAVETAVGWEVFYAKPDHTNRNSALEKVVKARGGYAPDKIAFTDTEGNTLAPSEIDKELEELEKQLRVNYIKEVKNESKDNDQSADRSKDSGA